MKRKKGEKTITQKKKILWKYFSKFIRNRDGFRCITCGKYATGSGMHSGHFIPSSICGINLRYDEDNVYAQCMRCNINLSGNYVTFREKLVERNGEDWVKKLEQRRHETTKDFNYDEKIALYKEKTKGMD